MPVDVHLVPGEKVLWTGAPERHPFFDVTDIVVVPMSLLWCTFAVVWETAVISDGVYFMAAFGIPFVAFGAYTLVGRLVVRAVRLRSTRYTVTNRRVVEVSDSPWSRRAEAYLRDLGPPLLRFGAGEAVGSIAFGEFAGFRDALYEAGLVRGRRGPRPIVLHHVRRPGHVRDLIAGAQR